MFVKSYFYDLKNELLEKIRQYSLKLSEKSFILTNFDVISVFSVCLALVASIFLKNDYTLYFLLAVCAFTGGYLLFFKNLKYGLEKCNLFLILYLIIVVLSAFTSSLPKESFHGLLKTLLYTAFYFSILRFLRDNRNKIKPIFLTIAGCVIFETAVAIIQNKIGVAPGATWSDVTIDPEKAVTRVYGTLQPLNPNLLGGYFVAAIPFLWGLTIDFFTRSKYLRAGIFTMFSILAAGVIFMTGCRGAYVALFFMSIVLCAGLIFFFKRFYVNIFDNLKKFKIATVTFVCGATALGLWKFPKITNRVLSIFTLRGDSSTSFRLNVFQSSIQMLKDNFLIGIGTGNQTFREIYGLYMLSGFDALSTYCIYTEIAVESGVFALAFFVLFLYYLFKTGIKTMSATEDKNTYIMTLAGILTVSGVLIHGFVDTVFFRPQIQLPFWCAVSVILAVSQNFDTENSST